MANRLLAASLFLLCAGVVFWFALVHTVHRGTLAVPDLVEKNLEEARQQVHDLGLEMMVEEPGVFSAVGRPGSRRLPGAATRISRQIGLDGDSASEPRWQDD